MNEFDIGKYPKLNHVIVFGEDMFLIKIQSWQKYLLNTIDEDVYACYNLLREAVGVDLDGSTWIYYKYDKSIKRELV